MWGVIGYVLRFPMHATVHNVTAVCAPMGLALGKLLIHPFHPVLPRRCFENQMGHNVEEKQAFNQALFGSS
jgi:hypothetical protein